MGRAAGARSRWHRCPGQVRPAGEEAGQWPAVVEGVGTHSFMGTDIPFGGDVNVLELGGVKCQQTAHSEVVGFILWEFRLNANIPILKSSLSWSCWAAHCVHHGAVVLGGLGPCGHLGRDPQFPASGAALLEEPGSPLPRVWWSVALGRALWVSPQC